MVIRRMMGFLAAVTLASGQGSILEASPLPDDKGVGTWVLMPLSPVQSGATASGVATVQIDTRARKICYAIDLNNVTDVTSISLSRGARGETGKPVVEMTKGREGLDGIIVSP